MDESTTHEELPGQNLALEQADIAGDKGAHDSRFPTLLAAAGFAFFWTVVVVVVFGSTFCSFQQGAVETFDLRALFLAGFACSHFLSYTRVIDKMAHAGVQQAVRGLVAITAVFFITLAFCDASGIVLPHGIWMVVWLLFGAALGPFLVLWGTVWTQIDAEHSDNKSTSLAITTSLACAGVLGTFMAFAPQSASVVAATVLLVASLVLQLYCTNQFPAPQAIDWRTSQKHLKLFSRNIATPGIAGLSFGIGIAVAMVRLDTALILWLGLAGVAAGGGIAAGAIALLGRVPHASSVERVVFPVLGCILLTMPFAVSPLTEVLVGMLVADAACYFVFHYNVLVALSYRHHVQTAFHYAQGLIAPSCGMALGWIAASIVAFALPLHHEQSLLVLSLSAVALILICLAIAPFASNKTVEAVFSDEADSTEAAPYTKPWRVCCAEVCDEHALTQREQEVFALLARGRNAEYIGKQLFISAHTVKTHSSRIYRKLDINSQQELIDLVDAKRTH